MRKTRKLQLHLTLRDPARLEELTDVLEKHSDFASEHEGASYRLVVTDDEARHGTFAARLGDLTFDTTLELGLPPELGDEPLLRRAELLREPLAPLVDASESAALLGDEIEFTPGDGHFQLNRLMRRRPDLTLERFTLHWATLHGDLGRQGMGPTPYRQLHRDPGPSRAAARAVGVAIDDFDGNAIVIYPDPDATPAIPPPPGHAEVMMADGALFVDRTRSVFGFGRVLAAAGGS